MPEIQNPQAQSGKILLITGTLCAFMGILMLANRLPLASFCFGAQFFFGVPLTGLDSIKLTVMTFGGLLTLVMSLVIVGFGMKLFLKPRSLPPQDAPTTEAS